MDKSKNNQDHKKSCRINSAPSARQVEEREDKLDSRGNSAIVSGKGSIKFLEPEEKGPGKMLQK